MIVEIITQRNVLRKYIQCMLIFSIPWFLFTLPHTNPLLLIIFLLHWTAHLFCYNIVENSTPDMPLEELSKILDKCGVIVLLVGNLISIFVIMNGESSSSIILCFFWIVLPFAVLNKRRKNLLLAMQSIPLMTMYIGKYVLFDIQTTPRFIPILRNNGVAMNFLTEANVIIAVLYTLHKTNTIHVERETQLMKTRDELVRTGKLRDQFIAKMSHEIRTPLNGIFGFSSMLMEKIGNSLNSNLRIIRKCANDIKIIIDDILDYNHLQEGTVNLMMKCFDLPKMVGETVERLIGYAHKKHLQISCDIDSAIPQFVEGDDQRLRQVILNIVSNAIKYTEKGEIILSCQKQEENEKEMLLLFKISDTGIGIKEDDMKKLFIPFMQIHNENVEKSSGLGLVISKELVQLMKGDIWLESKYGVGTQVYFTVWVNKTQKTPAPRRSPHHIHQFADRFKLNIMVAEDNKINQKVIVNLLKRFGYKDVTLVENGMEAIEHVKKEKIDLILMDIHMPILGGLEAATQIRSLDLKHQPCIYALTASASKNDYSACIRSGMNGFIGKPVSVCKLEAALKAASDNLNIHLP